MAPCTFSKSCIVVNECGTEVMGIGVGIHFRLVGQSAANYTKTK